MGTGEFPTPDTSVSAHAVLLRNLEPSMPVLDDTFIPDGISAIFSALKVLQVRMANFDHNLDKIDLGMSKLEHRIDKMEQQLHSDEENQHSPYLYASSMQSNAQQRQHQYLKQSCPPAVLLDAHRRPGTDLLAIEPP